MWLPSGIAGAAVTLTGSGRQARLVTQDDGAFRFDGLTPGKYNGLVAKDGYTLQGPQLRSMCMPEAAGMRSECSLPYHREGNWCERPPGSQHTGGTGSKAADAAESTPRSCSANQDCRRRHLRITQPEAGRISPGHQSGPHSVGRYAYTRYFYPGTEDPAQSAVAMVAEHAGTVTYDFPIPAPLKPQLVEGFVYEPNLQPVEKAQIMVEDTRWLWQTNRIAATTDANGHFEISVYDGTAYRIHAVTMARFTNQSLSAEPFISAPALASVNLSG